MKLSTQARVMLCHTGISRAPSAGLSMARLVLVAGVCLIALDLIGQMIQPQAFLRLEAARVGHPNGPDSLTSSVVKRFVISGPGELNLGEPAGVDVNVSNSNQARRQAQANRGQNKETDSDSDDDDDDRDEDDADDDDDRRDGGREARPGSTGPQTGPAAQQVPPAAGQSQTAATGGAGLSGLGGLLSPKSSSPSTAADKPKADEGQRARFFKLGLFIG